MAKIVRVNLARNKAILEDVNEVEIFCDGRFVIESDEAGCSYIELRDGDYYYLNILDGRVIKEEKLNARQAERIIRKVLLERFREGIW